MVKVKHNQGRAERLVIALVVLAVIGAVALAIMMINNRNDAPAPGADGPTQDEGPDFSRLSAIDSQGVLDFLAEKQSGFLYAGRPSCPHCQVFAPILIEVVREENLLVYYYNTDATRGEEKRTEALEAMDVVGVPAFMYVKSGKVVAQLQDPTNKEALLEFIRQRQ